MRNLCVHIAHKDESEASTEFVKRVVWPGCGEIVALEFVVRSHQGFMPLNYEEGATSAAGEI